MIKRQASGSQHMGNWASSGVPLEYRTRSCDNHLEAQEFKASLCYLTGHEIDSERHMTERQEACAPVERLDSASPSRQNPRKP